MKKIVFLFLATLALTAGMLFNAQPAEALQAQGISDWKSNTIKCTVTKMISVGIGVVTYEETQSYEGTMRKCVSGWGLCAWNGSCS